MSRKLKLYKVTNPIINGDYIIGDSNTINGDLVTSFGFGTELLLIDGVWVGGVRYVDEQLNMKSTRDILVDYGITLENFLKYIAETTSGYINLTLPLGSLTNQIELFIRKKLIDTPLHNVKYRIDVTPSLNIWFLCDRFSKDENIIGSSDLNCSELFIWQHPATKSKHVFVESYENNYVHYLGLKEDVLKDIL